MADMRVRDVNWYISTRRESALNTGYTAGAGFYRAVTNPPRPPVYPQFSYVDDKGRPELDTEFGTTRCIDYSLPVVLEFTDDVNTSYAGNLWLRAVGGAVTTAQQGGSAAYKHSAKVLAPSSSLQLPSTTVLEESGAISFSFHGCVVSSYTLSQQGTNRPQFSCTLQNTGKFVEPHGVTSLPTSVSLLTCLDGHQPVVSWTDTLGAQNMISSLCEIRGWSITINNNPEDSVQQRCIGDSALTITDSGTSITTNPRYVSKTRYGDRSITGQIVLLAKSGSIDDWRTYATNDILTDVTIRGQGAIIASTFRHSLGGIFEKAYITSVVSNEENGYLVDTIDFEAYYDSAVSTPFTAEVFNAVTANYD